MLRHGRFRAGVRTDARGDLGAALAVRDCDANRRASLLSSAHERPAERRSPDCRRVAQSVRARLLPEESGQGWEVSPRGSEDLAAARDAAAQSALEAGVLRSQPMTSDVRREMFRG